MAKQWQLLLIALLLALMIVKGVTTYSDDDDEDDEYFDDEYFEDDEDEYYYGEQKPKLKLNREEVIINTFTRTIQFQPPSYVPKTLYATTVTVKDTSVTTVTVKDNVVTKITEQINPVVGTPDDVPPVSVDPNESDSLNTPNVGSGVLDFEGLEAPLQDDTCSSTGLTNEIFRRFTGIFFGDFYTYGGTDILGPLAVKGTFIAPDYVVNGNQGTDCSAKDSVQSYGLVVGGAANTRNTQVHGSIFVGGGGDLTQLKQLENSCIVTGTQGTGLVDFIALEKEAVRLNGIYREHSPTLQLQSDGSLKRLASNDQSVEYLTFNSCNDRATCQNIWNGQMSVFDNMFGGVGNWNGIQGSIKPDASLTYVLNIPVIEDTTITLSSNQPVNGFNPCKLVLNFYPVKKTTGAYSPTGAFTILRNSAGQLGGLILSPRGNIRDGTTGNFAGNTIALSYTWAFTNGVELHNFQAAGGNCSFFSGCNPDPPDEGTPPVVTPSSCGNSTSTATSTATSLTTLTERFTVTNDVTKEIRVLTTQTDTTTKTDSFTETKTNNYTTTKTDSFTETTTDKFTETKTDNYTTTKTDSYTTTKTDSFTETNNVAATATVTITSTTDHDVTSTATTTDTTTATTTEVSLTTSTATTTQVSLDTTTEVSLSTTTEVSLSTTTEVSLSTTTEVSLSTTTEVSLSATTKTETTTLTTGRPPIVGGGGGPYSGGEDIALLDYITVTVTHIDTVTKTLGVASAPTVGGGLSSTVTVTVTDYPIASVPPSDSLTFVFTETLTYTRTFDENNGHYHGQQHDESCAYSHEEEDDEDDEDEDDDSCDEDEGDEDDDDDIDHYMKHNFHKQH